MALRARNLVQILINAKDNASKVIGGVEAGLSRLGAIAKTAGRAISTAFGALATTAATFSFARGLQSAADFETALDRIQAVTRSSAEELESLKTAAEDAGESTKFTATEAAEALENLVRTGKSATEAITALPSILNLAAAETLELSRASDIVTSSQAQFNLGIKETERIADVLVSTSQSAATNVEQLAQGLKEAGLVASQSGLSIEETAAALGVLANANIRGAQAGTALRNIILQLQQPTSKARIELEKLGISSSNINFAIQGLAAAGGDAKAALIAFGLEPAAAIQSLVRQAGDLQRLGGELQNIGGRAEEAAGVVGDNFQGAVKRFGSAIDSLQREVVEPFLPILTDLTEKATTFIQGVKNIGGDLNGLDRVAADVQGEFARLNTALQQNAESIKQAEIVLNALIRSGGEAGEQADSYRRRLERLRTEQEQLISRQRGLAVAVQNEVLPAITQSADAAERAASGLDLLDKSTLTVAENFKTLIVPLQFYRDELRRTVDAINNEARANKLAIERRIIELKSVRDLANAKQDENTARRASINIANEELAVAEASLAAKQSELKAAQETLIALQNEASKRSEVSEEILKEIEARKQNVAQAQNAVTAAENEVIAKRNSVKVTKELANDQQELGENTKQTRQETQKLGEEQEKTAGAMRKTAVVSGELNKLMTLLSANVKSAIFGGSEQTQRWSENLEELNSFLDRTNENLRTLQRFSSSLFLDIQNPAQRLVFTLEAYRDQLEGAERLQARLNQRVDEGAVTINEINRATQLTKTAFDLLDDSQLAGLKGAIDRARGSLQNLRDEAQQARDELERIENSLLDRIQTREQIEQRRFEEQIKRIRDLGQFDAAEASRVEDLAERAHQRALSRIREEQEAREERNQSRRRDVDGQSESARRPVRDTSNRFNTGALPVVGTNANFFIMAFDERQKAALARDVQQRLKTLQLLQ